MTSNNMASAFNPEVHVNEPHHIVQAAREQRVIDTEADVALIEQKITALEGDREADRGWRTKHLAALRAALKSATAEAGLARAEAREGSL